MISGAVAVGARACAATDLAAVHQLALAARAALVDARGGAALLAGDLHRGDVRGAVAASLEEPDALCVVGTLDDAVVGYLLVRAADTPGATSVATIGELFVEQGARQVGVGAAMLELTLEWATTRSCEGIDAVALPGDRATKNFFESHGLVARAIIAHRALP